MDLPDGLTTAASDHPRAGEVLTPAALGLLALLHRSFEPRRRELLAARAERVAALTAGGTLEFLPATAAVREDPDWRVAEPAPGLADRRCELIGPVDAASARAATASGAQVWLADLEDATTPTWWNVLDGQVTLLDVAADAAGARERPTVMVRPRGWHLPEKHVTVDGEEVSGSLTDFALHVANCGQAQIDAGRGPYYYLPKIESHLEAALWDDVFVTAQEHLGIARGTIRATVTIETYPAAFEMEEILHALREHSAGLSAGRWDYLFSVIKSFRDRAEFVLPDRGAVTMSTPFMHAWAELLVATCHRRGAHAIGGMSGHVPSDKPIIDERAHAAVRADKRAEAGDGFDGSWVAHAEMVPTCQQVFDAVLGAAPHQIDADRPAVDVRAEALLDVASAPGEVTEAGLRTNISVGIRYLESWMGGEGAVHVGQLVEDAGTAEVSRSQVWQWLHHGVRMDTGEQITPELVERLIDEELEVVHYRVGDERYLRGSFGQARDTFARMTLSSEYAEFMTLPAYARMP